jgi:Ni,Fe-hydrogenase III large subunit/Ni,Fe-hydrogenase III component G
MTSFGERATTGYARESALIVPGELVDKATALLSDGFRLATIAAHDDGPALRVVYVFASGPPDRRVELQLRLDATQPSVPSLGHLSFPASRFEREMHDLFGIVPVGHPFLRPLVLHQHWPEGWHPMLHDAGDPPPMRTDAEPFPFVMVEGLGVYEIPVGPVHAGLIEPGHFRFSVVGETIIKMKARLWFTHRGIEKLFEGRNVDDGVPLAERISGDSAIGHNLAYCLAIEEACGLAVPEEASQLRALLLEMERIYNHIADIGALCNDVGFGLAQARALTLREQLLRLNEEVTGHRLLRDAILPGSVSVKRLPTPKELSEIGERFEELVDLATSNTVVMERFRGTAVLSSDDAVGTGTLGVVARASGLTIDARVAHPFVALGEQFHLVHKTTGDVQARFAIRVDEVRVSLAVIEDLANQTSALHVAAPRVVHRGGSGVGIVEGWRGTIVHRVEVDQFGTITRLKIVDPSFLNWPALSVALADTIVPDFPLANKSFNLSYAGNDL